jgi:hypothetical protein
MSCSHCSCGPETPVTPPCDAIQKAGELSLVGHGASLGWADPPSDNEISRLLSEVAVAGEHGDACPVAAVAGEQLAGLGYGRRYSRATHRPHADIEMLAVDTEFQGDRYDQAAAPKMILSQTVTARRAHPVAGSGSGPFA